MKPEKGMGRRRFLQLGAVSTSLAAGPIYGGLQGAGQEMRYRPLG
jgi:hypothetical protein